MVEFKKNAKKVAPKSSPLRDKYNQGTSVKRLKSIESEEESIVGSSGYSDYLSIKDGNNKFRFFPSHNPDDKFLFPVKKSWLPVEGEGGEMKNKSIYNAKVHGNGARDVVEEYIQFVTEALKDSKDPASIKKVKALSDGKNKTSIVPQISWVGYAKKIEEGGEKFGLVEIKKTVRDRLYQLAYAEEADSEIEIDPFTPADTGRPAIIKYNSSAKKPADYYPSTTISRNEMPLTDEELQMFDGMTPLKDLFEGVYNRSHFEAAVEGLSNWDDQHDIGLFDTDEFQEIVQEISELFESDGGAGAEEEEKPKKKSDKNKAKSKKPVVDEEETEEAEEEENEEDSAEEDDRDELDDMDRKGLKQFIKDEELEVTVMKNWDDDELREKIREAYAARNESSEEEEYEEAEEAEEEEEPAPKTKTKPSVQKATEKASTAGRSKLEEIKERLAKNMRK